jgi:hypothetical protein
MTTPLRHTTIALAAVVAAAVAAVGAPGAGASPLALQSATSHCWLDVINDWLDNSRVDRVYAIPCYTQAIQKLSSYGDIAGYSSAEDDIHRALLAAVRQDRGDGPGGTSSGGPSSNDSGGGGAPPSNGGGGGGGSSGGGSNSILGIGGPTDATSVPLPLIILGALAVLLALAALGTWLARRYQTRRPRPAPAPAVAKRR